MKFKMVQFLVVCVFVFTGLSLTGCNQSGSKITQVNNVDQVLEQQVNSANENESKIEEIQKDTETVASTETSTEQDAAGEKNTGETDIDYDLTSMSSDMVYATVYQMMANPEEYIGKTVKMEGTYYSEYYEPTAKNYFYVIIQDAAACCAQGLEFIWADGSHVYPDEYPEEESDVVVTGIFETYQEEGDSWQYCRLKDAEMEIVSIE